MEIGFSKYVAEEMFNGLSICQLESINQHAFNLFPAYRFPKFHHLLNIYFIFDNSSYQKTYRPDFYLHSFSRNHCFNSELNKVTVCWFETFIVTKNFLQVHVSL